MVAFPVGDMGAGAVAAQWVGGRGREGEEQGQRRGRSASGTWVSWAELFLLSKNWDQ